MLLDIIALFLHVLFLPSKDHVLSLFIIQLVLVLLFVELANR